MRLQFVTPRNLSTAHPPKMQESRISRHSEKTATLVSVCITSLNEEANIARAVASARAFSDDVVVVDSGSTDETVALATQAGARVLARPFDDMAQQRNHVLREGGPKGRYVLFMDADEAATPEFSRELLALLSADDTIDGVQVLRRFHFWGRRVSAASGFPRYIDRVTRVGRVFFRKEGHGEAFVGATNVVQMCTPLHDEDLKPIGAWLERHNRYAEMEAAADLEIANHPQVGLPSKRRIRAYLRRLPGWPAVAASHYLFARRGVLEGREGRTYAIMKAMYEYFVQLHTADLRRRRSREGNAE